MANKTQFNQVVTDIVRGAVDDGRLIDLGWQLLRASVIHPDASETQVREMRMAFFAGAQHVYSSIMGMFEHGEGTEPTITDIDRMTKINDELKEFTDQFKAMLEKKDLSS